MPISPGRGVAFDILLRVEQQGAYAADLLHSALLGPLNVADRALATELVMGVLRWRSRLDQTIAAASARPLAKVDIEVLTALRLGAYQLGYLDRIPAHAAIDESVELVKRARKHSAAGFANAVLRNIAGMPGEIVSEPHPRTVVSLAREFAHPQWLVERWVEEYGTERAELICRHNQRVPKTAIRVDSVAVERELQAEGIELAPGALLAGARIVADGDVSRTRAFQQGRVFIQDEASQLVAALVGTGSRLLDCCAAPGGKTAALAARNPTAEIIAVELHPHRAELLRKRVRATNVHVIQADVLNLPSFGAFDRVLADVPCSGTGTLARNPEIKWRLKPEDLGDLRGRQVAILHAAVQRLAPGGRAVYSTCSLEHEENEAVMTEILGESNEFVLRDCSQELRRLRSSGELLWPDLDALLSGPFLRTIPGLHPCDGFFAAVIERR
ncbi:MAG TPA: 16S rRNA (cytosine(967)-C(5))-methyltransferase RsmB [Terriglobales bacterium]|nr:16S rRNA (cytosine(967)-C(5))-methyltransferase RsmB [Terriglobales bacterium]